MNILHVIHSLAGGGAERQLCAMLKYVKNTSMTMAVFCVSSRDKDSELSEGDIFIISDPSRYPWGLVGEINRVIGEFKPDIIHCWLPVPVIIPAMIAAKKNKLPIVASYRNRKEINGVYDIIEYLAVKAMATAIASNNPPEQSSSAFEKLFQRKVSAYIPNSISINCTAFPKKEKQMEINSFTILFVGRIFDAQKNWRALLHGLKLMDVSDGWQLLICGDGKERAELIDEIENTGLDGQVQILGYRKDIYNLMASADVLVLPSWYEGMPNVVIEAMALSLPCIVSSIPAHQKLFGNEAGVSYIDPAEPSTIANILKKMINGKVDMDEMARQGLVFSARFTPEKLMDSYKELYRRTLVASKKLNISK